MTRFLWVTANGVFLRRRNLFTDNFMVPCLSVSAFKSTWEVRTAAMLVSFKYCVCVWGGGGRNDRVKNRGKYVNCEWRTHFHPTCLEKCVLPVLNHRLSSLLAVAVQLLHCWVTCTEDGVLIHRTGLFALRKETLLCNIEHGNFFGAQYTLAAQFTVAVLALP
jgi:hypothetical protein